MRIRTPILLTLGLWGTFAPAQVFACGGVFCAIPQGPTPPAPVDQTAERIIFEVDPGRVTAHVQIRYLGEPEGFAWVVPVPDTPQVEESSEALFAALDEASQLEVRVPPSTCILANSVQASASCSCGDNDFEMPQGNSPVVVYASGFTDSYEYSVIGAERSQDLVDWLVDNRYNVSSNMTPVMDLYNGPQMRFLALKLRANKDASDIAPIRMRYAAEAPMIPIQLTKVAAQPLMGILVFILADSPYVPSNFEWVRPKSGELIFDENNRTSYFEWVARTAEEAEGKLFVAEYVGALPLAPGEYGDQRVRHSHLSRFYTRISPEYMNEDPRFVADGSVQVENLLDLSAQMPLYDCNGVIEERRPSACAFQYCGAGAECVAIGEDAACRCPQGKVATSLVGPDGVRRVTCTPAEAPFGVTAEAGAEGTEFDPCLRKDCGAGACVLKAGFATCACEAGAVARLVGEAERCVEVALDVETFGPGAGPESRRVDVTLGAVSRGRGFGAYAGGFWGLVLVVLVCRRGRRRGQGSRL